MKETKCERGKPEREKRRKITAGIYLSSARTLYNTCRKITTYV